MFCTSSTTPTCTCTLLYGRNRVARVNYGGIESLTAWTHKAREQDKGNFLLKAEQLEKLLAQIGYRSPCIKVAGFVTYIHRGLHGKVATTFCLSRTNSVSLRNRNCTHLQEQLLKFHYSLGMFVPYAGIIVHLNVQLESPTHTHTSSAHSHTDTHARRMYSTDIKHTHNLPT